MQDVAVRLNWCYRRWSRSYFRRMCWRCKRHGWLGEMHPLLRALPTRSPVDRSGWNCGGGRRCTHCSRPEWYYGRKLNLRWVALLWAVVKEGRRLSLGHFFFVWWRGWIFCYGLFRAAGAGDHWHCHHRSKWRFFDATINLCQAKDLFFCFKLIECRRFGCLWLIWIYLRAINATNPTIKHSSMQLRNKIWLKLIIKAIADYNNFY